MTDTRCTFCGLVLRYDPLWGWVSAATDSSACAMVPRLGTHRPKESTDAR